MSIVKPGIMYDYTYYYYSLVYLRCIGKMSMIKITFSLSFSD